MKALATLTAASILMLAGAAVAQQATPPAAPGQSTPATPAPENRTGMTRADRDALTDARLAGIPAGLKLTDEQRRLWTPVEQALRAQASERAERIDERRERLEARRSGGAQPGGAQRPPQERADFMERLERQTATVTERAERMRTLTAALKPFWASLDDQQKRLLPRLLRPAQRGRDGGMRHRDGRPGPGGPRQP